MRKEEWDNLDYFEFFGFLIGGVVPISLAFVVEVAYPSSVAGANRILFYPLCFFFVVFGISTFAIIHLLTIKNQFHRWIVAFAANSQAVVGLLVMHAMVLLFGGIGQSVFTFSYLYVPAVVGFTHPTKTLIATSVFCGILFVHAVWPDLWGLTHYLIGRSLSELVELGPNTAEVPKVLYVLIFLIQLVVATYLAPRARVKNHKDETESASAAPAPATE